MAQKSVSKDRPTARQIVGFSLPPERAAAVKVEAARRGISLKKLFEDMWAAYEKTTKKNER
jgi:hypothetical protein